MHQRRGAYFAALRLPALSARAYRRSVDCIDTNGEIWFCLADAYDRLGEPRKAMDAYAPAIAQAPALPGPRTNLAVLLAQAGYRREAADLLREELRLDPDNLEARANLDRVLQDQTATGAGDR